MKIIKKIGKWILILLIVLNLAILISGKIYIYRAVGNTYLKGRSGPSIDEYKIFENSEVKVGKPIAWNRSINVNKSSLLDAQQKQFIEMQTVAFLIIKNDSIAHEQYWDGYGADSYTNSFSMAKTFVSILIGAAIEDGNIKNVDQSVGDFLPEYKVGENSKITIKHLLTMSSGIDFDENYTSPLAYPAAAYYGTDLQKLTMSYNAQDAPGKIFKYLSGNSELLGFILEKATGKKLSAYMSEKLWQKIGAQNPAYWSLDHAGGTEKAYCCFNSNAQDFARIGELYLDSGKYYGNQIIKTDYVLNSVSCANLIDSDGKQIDNYGYAWWLIPNYNGHSIFYARGILGQYIICIPDQKMVIVRLGKKREKRHGNDHPIDLYYYIDAALEMYGTK